MGDITKATSALNQVALDDKLILLQKAFPDVADDAIRAALGITETGEAAVTASSKLANLGKAGKGAGAVLTNTFSKLGALVVAHPIIAILAGIAVAFTAVSAVVTDAQEKVEEAISSYGKYETAQSEAESLRSELETIGTQIDELNAKENLSFTDQQELANLQAQSAELERQLEIKDAIAKREQENAARDASEAFSGLSARNAVDMNKTGFWTNIADGLEYASAWVNDKFGLTELNGEGKNSGGIIGLFRGSKTETTDKIFLDRIQSAIKAQEELNKIQNEAPELTGNYDYDTIALNQWTRKVEEQQQVVNNYADDLQNLYSEMESITPAFYNADGSIVSGYEDEVARWEKVQSEYLKFIGEASHPIESTIDGILSKVEYSEFEDILVKVGQNGSKALERALSSGNYDGLIDSLAETLDISTDEAQSHLHDYIMAIADPDALKMDVVREQLAEAFTPDDVDAETAKQQWQDFTKDLSDEDLTILYSIKQSKDTSTWTLEDWKHNFDEARDSAIDLSEAIEKVNSRISVLNQLGTEGISSDKLLDAISEADETRNAGDDYVQADTYLDEAKEMYDKGLIGTDDFKARAAYFSPTMATDPANFIENYKKAKNYLTENATGLLNFLNDLEDKGLASSKVLKDGTKQWTYDIKDFESAAQKMGISTEFMLDIFGRLEDYGFSNNFASNVEEANEKIVDKAAELANAKAKLAEMETTGQYTTLDENGNEVKTMANSTALQEQRELVQLLEQDLLQLQNTREYLASREADTYAEQVKQAKETYSTIAEERKRILEDNTYGEDTQIVADLMEEQLRKIAEENHLQIDSELNIVNEDQLEDTSVEVDVKTEGAENLVYLDEVLNVLTLKASDGITIKLNNTEEIDYAVTKIEQFPTDIPVDISFNVANQEQAESLSTTLDELNTKRSEGNEISYTISIANSAEVVSNVETLDNKQIDDKNYDVTFNYQENISQLNTINNKSISDKEYTVTQRQQTIIENPLKVKTSKASGTLSPALASGTAYNMLNLQPAYAGGKVALPEDQTALVNEMGTEGLIRDGQLYKIPGGMHYQNLKQGDIILSASQMEQLERTGKATGKGNPIGWARSFAQGSLGQPTISAYAGGAGGGSFGVGGSGSKSGVTAAGTKANTKATQDNTKATQDNTSSNENLYDWIERMITAFERTLQRYETLMSDETNWVGLQNSLRESTISAINSQLPQYQQAYDYYMNKANSVGLSDNYKVLAQNGLINIEEIADENLRQKIEDYENWLGKARQLEDTIADLNIQLKELKMQRLDDVIDSTDTVTGYHQSFIDMFDASQEVLIASGEKASEALYNNYFAHYAEQRRYYAQEVSTLQEELDKLVADGTIVKYSDKWVEYDTKINEAKQSLYETNQAVAELENTILELKWSYFEDGIKTIENMEDALSGLADLIDDTMMFAKDSSALTGLGAAKIGLLQNQMTQARQKIANYSKAIRDLTIQYRQGDISQSEYEEGLAELQKSQLDAAKQLKDSKDAIIDYIKEGIDREVEAMRELKDARQESLDLQREYYEFNEKVKDQTSEIAKIDAQLAALRGSDSVEAQAKIRQLESQKAELEKELSDTQRDREQDLIDQGYDEFMEEFEQNAEDYKETLDSSIEAQNQAIESFLGNITAHSTDVYNGLNQLAEEYGFVISNSIVSTWQDAQKAVEDYAKAVGLIKLGSTTESQKDYYNALLSNTNKATVAPKATDKMRNLLDAYINGTLETEQARKVVQGGEEYLTKEPVIVTDKGVFLKMAEGSSAFNKELYELSKSAIPLQSIGLDSMISPAHLSDAVRVNTGSNEMNIHYDSVIGNIEYVDKNALPELETIIKKSFDYTVKELRKQTRKL